MVQGAVGGWRDGTVGSDLKIEEEEKEEKEKGGKKSTNEDDDVVDEEESKQASKRMRMGIGVCLHCCNINKNPACLTNLTTYLYLLAYIVST